MPTADNKARTMIVSLLPYLYSSPHGTAGGAGIVLNGMAVKMWVNSVDLIPPVRPTAAIPPADGALANFGFASLALAAVTMFSIY